MKKTSKYSVEDNQRLSVAAFGVLEDAARYMTIAEICNSSLELVNQTPQKMARILNDLVETTGMVQKSKNKEGRVVYASISVID